MAKELKLPNSGIVYHYHPMRFMEYVNGAFKSNAVQASGMIDDDQDITGASAFVEDTEKQVTDAHLKLENLVDGWGNRALNKYFYIWNRNAVAVSLGYGSLYNHSYRPNARYVDLAGRTKLFTAIRDIAAGEEITVNYNGEPEDETPVGFEVVECLNSSGMSRSVDGAGDRR